MSKNPRFPVRERVEKHVRAHEMEDGEHRVAHVDGWMLKVSKKSGKVHIEVI